MEVIADTTVLIDLWRYRKTPRRLADLSAKIGDAAILIPWITQAEFSRGALFKGVSPEALSEFYARFHLLPFDQSIIDHYCRLWATMARKGDASGYPDLWIAACAVAANIPVVTRNRKHFAGIPDLEVISYGIGRR
jgi:predicted nucleic acid-binding protein